ncbi:polyamine ABC transporter substrate-binding protein [Phenylobacterium sp. J426]|uniref:polyamine ABC transporter substrate-binding protein n=1 Tax=Phenylobacterium sp. J426 TaxID=2898439 RepID=UPI002150A755|nr:polyamine ABC transporter substrate-binding protein [Phenylobacterium sp. J426]MCR5875333.1 polyamine ABC transporter substrate-binding protein [Phenylobacterium sp. J426]
MAHWRLAIGVALALFLAACGKPAEQVRIYNWSDYIDPALLEQFTQETGIEVTYDTFDSNEILETKVLQGGTGYDLVVPSNHNLPRYITAGAIQPLEKAKLPGLSNLSPDLMAKLAVFDPSGTYAVPYMQGTIGIGYNTAQIAKRLPGVAIDSWDVVFDPKTLAKLKDCGVYFLDASEDMYAVALNYLGKDPNSTAAADYGQATDLLLKARPYVRKFHSSEYIEALANGDACVAIGYSGDVLQAKARAAEAKNGVELAYVVPKEGSQIWFDVFTIPKDAPNPDAAHRFLAFMLRPDVIAKASDYVQYANANAAATPLVDEAVRNDPNVYPTPAMAARLFVTTTKDQGLLRDVNRQWTRVLTAR